ncbi:MAG: serine hydrolase domain-containing protein [Egibacteraceae bacterium]
MSSGGLPKARLARMHDVMAGHVERGDVPGVVTLVSRRGEVHVDAIGTREAGGSDPIRHDTIFRISSLTKPITAVATMILVGECRLRLDEPVDRLLPELADRKVLTRLDGPLDDTVPANRPITVRDLLTLRMGVGFILEPGGYPILQVANERQVAPGPPNQAIPQAPDEWIRRVATLPLMRQPGEAWMYGTALSALGVLIARASGQPSETFFRRPNLRAARHDRHRLQRADGEARPARGLLSGQSRHPLRRRRVLRRSPAFPDGAGGLVSTIDDYLAFGQMMLRQGKPGKERLLSRPSVQLMTTDHLTPEQRGASTIFLGTTAAGGSACP